jgi:hypothetical protein
MIKPSEKSGGFFAHSAVVNQGASGVRSKTSLLNCIAVLFRCLFFQYGWQSTLDSYRRVTQFIFGMVNRGWFLPSNYATYFQDGKSGLGFAIELRNLFSGW